jgi:hypothetical protein
MMTTLKAKITNHVLGRCFFLFGKNLGVPMWPSECDFKVLRATGQPFDSKRGNDPFHIVQTLTAPSVMTVTPQ